jgi:hypothetical protein
MSLADDLIKLQELHRSGALSDDEFVRAKSAVIAAAAPVRDEKLATELAELRREQELARIDREWETERHQYEMTGAYGRRFTPSKLQSALTCIGSVVFGILFVWAAGNTGGIFAVFASAMSFCFVIYSAYGFVNAARHHAEMDRYMRRRSLVLAEERANEPDAPPAPAYSSPLVSTDFRDLSGGPEDTGAIRCLRCKARMTENQERCPECGWSYT